MCNHCTGFTTQSFLWQTLYLLIEIVTFGIKTARQGKINLEERTSDGHSHLTIL